jgi:putative transposase
VLLIYKGEAFAVDRALPHLLQLERSCLDKLHSRFLRWTKPLSTSLTLGTLTDLSRSKPELIAENALLRQQLIMLRRQVKRPACNKADRTLLILLASTLRRK